MCRVQKSCLRFLFVGVNVAVERKKTDEGVRSLLGFVVAVEGRWGLGAKYCM